MKFTALLISACLQVSAGGLAQTVSLSEKNASLKEIFKEIHRQTGYEFLCSSRILARAVPVDIAVKDAPLEEVLAICFSKQPLTYTISGKTIVVKPRDESQAATDKEAALAPLSVSGTVKDPQGTPMPGVNVVVKGTTLGTSTDSEGRYAIDVEENAILVFSFIGFTKQEVPINGRSVIDVTLEQDITSLDEVVVIGYGTQKKLNVTGSITTVGGEQLKRSPATSLSNSLAGRLPGLIATQRSGEPGKDESGLLIRGLSTLGNNSPLIVVDGVPGRSLDQINPNDVESISVLKDASAAAYGSRSANGVILITTKRGSTDKTNVSYSANYGWQIPTRLPEFANSYEFTRLYNEAQKNDNPNAAPAYSDEDIQKYKDGSDPDRFPNTDWYKEALRPSSPQTQHTLAVTGGGKSARLYVAGSYFSQDGMFVGGATNFKRYSFVSNVDADINKNLKASVDIQGRQENRDYPGLTTELLMARLQVPPIYAARYSNGVLASASYYAGRNPLIESTDQRGFTDDKNQVIQTKFTLRQLLPFITPGLAMEGSFAYDKSYRHAKSFLKPYKYHDLNFATGEIVEKTFVINSSLNEYYQDDRNSYGRFSLDYARMFGKHNITALALYEFEDYSYSYLAGFRDNFPVSVPMLNLGANNNNRSNSGYSTEFARQSYFGRINYIYNNRYLLELSMRADASANFPESGRWGYFPSVLAGWIISDESWFKVNFVSNLKLRGSWSVRGNDRVGNFQYLSIFGLNADGYVLNDQPAATMYPLVAANPNITWEKAESYNIGLDASLFSNKLEFSFDYFEKKTKDILATRNASVPLYTGISLPAENIAHANAAGFETEFTYRNRVGELNYFVRGNLAYAQSKIIFIDEPENVPEYQRRTDHPIGAATYLIAQGLFQSQEEIDTSPKQFNYTLQPGDIRYKDVNSDGIVNGLDFVRIDQTLTPWTTFGFSLGGDFKGFDIALLFQGASKSSLFLYGDGAWPFYNVYNLLQKYVDNRWTPENPNATLPRLSVSSSNNNTQRSTFWLKNANYLRLKNVEVGYAIPQSIIKKISVSSARIFANALNLFTIDEIKTFDPEYPDGRGWNYPQQKVINVGINVQF